MNEPATKSTQESLEFPRVGLGCMGMSEFYGQRDDEASLEVLHEAFAIGYRHFDTADMYGLGDNERLVGRFLGSLSRAERSGVLLATKVGIVRSPDAPKEVKVDSSPTYVRRAVESSLLRLEMDSVELLYLHRRSPDIPIEDTVGELECLRVEGKIRAIGLSEVAPETLRRACKEAPIAALQSEYSLWTRDPEHEALPTCTELGVRYVAYSPLGRGFFGNASAKIWENPGDIRHYLPRFQSENLARNLGLRERLDEIASAVGMTAPELALAWVTRHPTVTAIPGSRSKKHLTSNYRAVERTLEPDVVAVLNEAFQPSAVSGPRYPEPLLATVNL